MPVNWCKWWGHVWEIVPTNALNAGFYVACERCGETITPAQHVTTPLVYKQSDAHAELERFKAIAREDVALLLSLLPEYSYTRKLLNERYGIQAAQVEPAGLSANRVTASVDTQLRMEPRNLKRFVSIVVRLPDN